MRRWWGLVRRSMFLVFDYTLCSSYNASIWLPLSFLFITEGLDQFPAAQINSKSDTYTNVEEEAKR
jgi:hypothetical protein